mmetsp:Transcript_18337/g.73495  ORF Transcript_18337/g.73495 Transcript_18337/m.73495 type:complete len:347 (-) Transcript_18337:2605-3645(-)
MGFVGLFGGHRAGAARKDGVCRWRGRARRLNRVEMTADDADLAENGNGGVGKDNESPFVDGVLRDSVLETIWRSQVKEKRAARPVESSQYSMHSTVRRIAHYLKAKESMNTFVNLFEGEFDNYEQVVEERQKGIKPREGGGHEHIHCQLKLISDPTLNDNIIFAKYYFDGNPRAVFRSRIYKVWPVLNEESRELNMRIFRLYEELEQELRSKNYDPTQVEWGDESELVELYGCNVYWNDEGEDGNSSVFTGYMKEECCQVFSPVVGDFLHIYDDLLLNDTHLSVNDRGFNSEGDFVYGNRIGLPYVMRRLTGEDDPLWWTVTGEEEARKAKSFNTSLKTYVRSSDT